MSKDNIYCPSKFEQALYESWKQQRLFNPTPEGDKNFSIILPPPNVTGQLHLGHAWDGFLQDTIIRYKKLKGFRTVWIPGTDHAGIATQTKFERILKDRGIDRKKMNDTEFLKQLYDWSKEQGQYIHEQWAKLGFALAYDYETYTLDDNVKQLVKSAFVNLYQEKLIYRGYKLVNWDVKQKTAISDIEVIHRQTASKMFYFKYLIERSKDSIIVATTRPETMFVDAAIFINPKDKRYAKIAGKNVINPINGHKLKVMADSYVDMKFGTGAMKCTPAHDFNDYQLAIKHNLNNYETVMNPDGTLNHKAKTMSRSYQGQDRLKARSQIVEDIKNAGLLIKVEDHTNEIGYSERTGEVVEPLLSMQWFIKMAPLAKETIALIKKEKPNFIPKRFEKTMNTWLNNVQDWCISRQLLWGHKVPVWYQKDTGKVVVGAQPKDMKNYRADKDVLDTWFSSGLWPLALTKYNKDANLSDFYPISMLVTGYDILFFWVARMFFQCGHISKTIPLKAIFFHGLIRDEQNRKMSKSLGNGINPMNTVDKYGADALHMFLTSTATVGEDLRYSDEKIKYYWAFINKLWNAHNFLMQFSKHENLNGSLHPINGWIVNEFNNMLKQVNRHMDAYNFVIANKHLVDFTWEVYCNQYLEFIKPLLNDEKYKNQTLATAHTIMRNVLVLLHPHIPFASEKIYLELQYGQKSIMLETWPKSLPSKFDTKTKLLMNELIQIYSFTRALRVKYGIRQTNIININLITRHKIKHNDINELTKMFNINIGKMSDRRINIEANIESVGDIVIEYENTYADIHKEKEKLEVQLAKIDAEIKRSTTILSNPSFISKAPTEKVQVEKEKLEQYQNQYKQIEEAINKFK